MDEARSSCPGPTAEDTLHNINRAPVSRDADRRNSHPRAVKQFNAPLRHGQDLPRHRHWSWIAEDLFDEDKW